MMLRELQAFEACWLDLKDSYPTSQQDNTLIAHAMGQLVDAFKPPTAIEQELPDHLQILFRRLALAYFQGYFPARSGSLKSAPRHPSEQTAGAPAVDRVSPSETCPAIVAAVDQVRELALQAQERMRLSRAAHPTNASLNELETLIIKFPDYWQADSMPRESPGN
jgi:hypothetical protein